MSGPTETARLLGSVQGVVVQMRAFYFDGDNGENIREEAIPADILDNCKKAREELIAAVGDFEIFGETWITEPITQSVYEREWGIPNHLDFPLYDALGRYAGGLVGGGPVMLRLEDDDYSRTADGRAPTPGTFIGNHDIGRTAISALPHDFSRLKRLKVLFASGAPFERLPDGREVRVKAHRRASRHRPRGADGRHRAPACRRPSRRDIQRSRRFRR